jgi:hypothetical protein
MVEYILMTPSVLGAFKAVECSLTGTNYYDAET